MTAGKILVAPDSETCRIAAPMISGRRMVSRSGFASDRSHVRDSRGHWRHPPPPWDPIGSGMHLANYLDPETPGPGRLLDLAGARVWLASEKALSVP